MTDTLNIVTNNVPRDIVEAWQLTDSERAEFGYLDWDAIDRGEDSASFVRYKGELLDLAEFQVWDNPASPTRHRWDGIRTDTFFSGVLVRYTDDNYETVVVARFYC